MKEHGAQPSGLALTSADDLVALSELGVAARVAVEGDDPRGLVADAARVVGGARDDLPLDRSVHLALAQEDTGVAAPVVDQEGQADDALAPRG